MITNVSSLRLAQTQDPFSQFSVEFGDAIQPPAELGDGPEAPTFGKVLEQALGEVNAAQHDSANLTFQFATGKPVDIHTMMIAAAKADVLLQLTSAVVSKTATGVNQLLQTQV